MSNLIYDPDKDFEIEKQKLYDLIQRKECLLNLHKKLSSLIQTLSCINDVEAFDLTINDDFCATLQFMYDNWPNGYSLSRSKVKLFVIDFKKFVSRTKKNTTLKKDKLDKLISEWFQENEKIYIEIIKLISEIATQNKICDRFVVSNGNWIQCQQKNDNGSSIKPPQNNDHVCISLQYLTPNKWYSWPTDFEFLTRQKYKPKDVGIGAGENWLAHLFGGTVQGQNSTFDIALFNKSSVLEKWEVKEYDEKSLTIRLGSNGTNATEKMSLEIYDIVMQLKSFYDTFNKLQFDKDDKDETIQWLFRYTNSLNDYLNNNFSKLVIRGELGNSDLQELVAPIRGAIVARETILKNYKHPELSIQLNNQTVQYTIEQSINVLLTLCDKLSNNDKLFAVISTLKHPILLGTSQYRDFLQQWATLITPLQAFGDIDGVFLVHKNGFRIIPKESLNDSFEYIRMSQGRRPNFKIKNSILIDKFENIGFFGYSYSNAMFGNTHTLMSGSIDTQQYIPDDELFAFTSPWNNVHINTQLFTNKPPPKILPAI